MSGFLVPAEYAGSTLPNEGAPAASTAEVFKKERRETAIRFKFADTFMQGQTIEARGTCGLVKLMIQLGL